VSTLPAASPASLDSNLDVGEEGESEAGDSEEGDNDASLASLCKITTLGDSDNEEEDDDDDRSPDAKRKEDQAKRTRKSQKKEVVREASQTSVQHSLALLCQ